MKSILYIHGFNSSGLAYKAQQLRIYFSDCNIISPTLDYYNLTPEEIVAVLKHEYEENRISMIIGTSLGGMLAMYLSAIYNQYTLSINPAIKPQCAMRKFIGENVNFVTGKTHILTKEAFAAYENFISKDFEQQNYNPEKLFFALSTDDELLGSYSSLKKKYAAHNISEFTGTGHRFFQFELLVPLITNILEKTTSNK